MDRFSDNFGASNPVGFDEDYGFDSDIDEDEIERQAPPPEIGQDERRMQVRAYNHWASLLGERNFPSIEDLEPENLPDFGPHSVLLDFTGGIENPGVPHLGEKLAEECGTDESIDTLGEVPTRSLLSRITDHYMQILANQAPIGFEAEFVNQRGATILYRGILLPFSSDDESIDFIYGVINWKEMADQITTDELLLEIDQALDVDSNSKDKAKPSTPSEAIGDWADGPGSTMDDIVPLPGLGSASDAQDEDETTFPEPSFGSLRASLSQTKRTPLDLTQDHQAPAAGTPDIPVAVSEPADEFGEAPDAAEAPVETGLYDCLAAARESAQAARSCEDRSRSALYEAVGQAYDVSLAAADQPQEFAALVEENGLTVQDRAPMTPVVKLVFGADYDKTRLTEYAAVLGHAHRMGIERGTLSNFLKSADGGLKGVVSAERRVRRQETGKAVEPANGPRASIARKLRAIEPRAVSEIEAGGPEFALVMIRRLPDGSIGLLGELGQDIPLVERAARKLLG